jgi:hypothetical protein
MVAGDSIGNEDQAGAIEFPVPADTAGAEAELEGLVIFGLRV